jgi:hypothetical protein
MPLSATRRVGICAESSVTHHESALWMYLVVTDKGVEWSFPPLNSAPDLWRLPDPFLFSFFGSKQTVTG